MIGAESSPIHNPLNVISGCRDVPWRVCLGASLRYSIIFRSANLNLAERERLLLFSSSGWG